MSDGNSIVIPKSSVLAVSGGVDSMVLLDLARRQLPASQFVVAHFRHGIRSKAEQDNDTSVISSYCQRHELSLEVGERTADLKLRSEQALRKSRYEFLRSIAKKYSYNNIITAHHKDDLIETALINIIRGTGPRGLVSLALQQNALRPMLEWSKSAVLTYAKENNVSWHEDSTNSSSEYLRNRLRGLMAEAPAALTDSLHRLIVDQIRVQSELHARISSLNLGVLEGEYSRQAIRSLPQKVRSEWLVQELRDTHDFQSSSQKNTLLAVQFVCCGREGSAFDLSGSLKIKLVGGQNFIFETTGV